MGKKRRRTSQLQAEAAAEADDDADEPELTGFVEADTLYLRDGVGTVYSSERDDRGRLVVIGTWDSAAAAILPLPTPPADADANADADADATADADADADAPQPALQTHPPPPPLAFEADEQDHCETAPEAYADVVDVLHALATRLGVGADALRVYDPYFCNGAVARHLSALGFSEVYNKNEDFYAVQAARQVPAYDVLLTNPPYSASHPELILNFCAASKRPWLLLMPNWVFTRPFYADSAAALAAQFYLLPRKRYHYWTPRGRRADIATGGAKAKTHGHTKAALGVRTSPFISFWVGGGFPKAVAARLRPPSSCILARSLREVPRALLADALEQPWSKAKIKPKDKGKDKVRDGKRRWSSGREWGSGPSGALSNETTSGWQKSGNKKQREGARWC